MATIIGAIATSHTPTIGFAADRDLLREDPAWSPIFDAYVPVKAWLAEKRPDVLLVVYNDHVTSFFFDHYSAFCLGVDSRYEVADEGGGPRKIHGINANAALARHIGTCLMAEEFDMSFFQGRPIDHGCFSPLSMLADHQNGWPWQIIPLQVGVLQFPIPTARRCFKLGQALRRAIESYPEDLKVVMVGTGGLSHQVHGERSGFNNTSWDEQFLDLIESDPEPLAELSHADYARLGGLEGTEVIMWLVMRGALTAKVRRIHRAYYLPSMTGIATLVLENETSQVNADLLTTYCAKVAHQLKDVEKIEGTHPFSLEISHKAYRLNKFLHDMVILEHRAQFREDPESAFEKAGLTQEERHLIRTHDWIGLIHYGAIFFGLEKLGAVTGFSNPEMYAAMAGMSFQDFQKTRNVEIKYSVAGEERK